jgi:alpha-tubulin suppressor-like RCC1 family protein
MQRKKRDGQEMKDTEKSPVVPFCKGDEKEAKTLRRDACFRTLAWQGIVVGVCLFAGCAPKATPPVQTDVAQASHPITLKRQMPTVSGTIWIWGRIHKGDDSYELVRVEIPEQVPLLDDVVEIAGGQYHFLALKGDGSVWAWGSNHQSQLGIGPGTGAFVRAPQKVYGMDSIVSVVASQEKSVALKRDGTVWAWGVLPGDAAKWPHGVVPDNTAKVPQIVEGFSDIVAIGAGEAIIGLRSDGTVLARTELNCEAKFRNAVGIAADWRSYLAISGDGSVWQWGVDPLHYSLLMDQYKQFALHIVPGLQNVAHVRTWAYEAFAITNDGGVYGWGQNKHGQLGDGTTRDRASPVRIPGLPRLVDLATGFFGTLAIDEDGMVWEWRVDRDSIPHRNPYLKNVVGMAVSENCFLALVANRPIAPTAGGDSGESRDEKNVEKDK